MKLIVPTVENEFSGFSDQFQALRRNAKKIGPGQWGALDHIQVIEDEKTKKPKLVNYKDEVVAEGHDIFGHLKRIATNNVMAATS